MSWVATAVVGGAVIGGVASNRAAGKAADVQSEAASQSNATQLQMYNQTREDNAPALDARNASLARMRELLGIGGDAGAKGYGSLGGNINVGDVTSDPGYQFGLEQGQRALNNQLAARGMRNSGAALKAASRYGNDYATTKYDQSFNRLAGQQANQFNRFASVAGLGQTGANMLGAAGQNYANQVSATQQGLGNALGAGAIAQGNALSSAANQLGGWYSAQRQQSNLAGYNGAVSGGAGWVNPSGGVYESGSYGGGMDGTSALPW